MGFHSIETSAPAPKSRPPKTSMPPFPTVTSGHRYYDLGLGRFLCRDPKDETALLSAMATNELALAHDHVNLFAFAANSPIDAIDYIGFSTIDEAANNVCGCSPGKLGVFCRLSCRSKRTTDVFLQWAYAETAAVGWWAALPPCPKTICVDSRGPENPDRRLWYDPIRPGNAESGLHTGCTYSMRSIPVSTHGNQCTYDGSGTLLTTPPASGTVDWIAPGSGLGVHFSHDVEPAIIAARLDGNTLTWPGLSRGTERITTVGAYLSLYYAVRPLY
jgi:hypothetical protein